MPASHQCILPVRAECVAVAVASVNTALPGLLPLDAQLPKEGHCLTWLLSVTGEWGRNRILDIEKHTQACRNSPAVCLKNVLTVSSHCDQFVESCKYQVFSCSGFSSLVVGLVLSSNF